MRVLIIVLGLICAVCAAPRQSRIVGGETTTIENYPFMAGMLGEWEGVFTLGCGATLISPTSVVTAAHCFEGIIVPLLRVRLGTDLDKSGGIEHIVSRIIVHPEYDGGSLINDIQILRLRDPAVYSDKINRARIPGPRYDLPANTVVYAVGWGDVLQGGPHSEKLRHVALDVIDHKVCSDRHHNVDILPEIAFRSGLLPSTMLCTGILDVGGKDSCQGDSGGPVIHNRDVLVGIISSGRECGHPFVPAVNVRVSSYTDWIYTNSVSNNTLDD